MAMTFEQMQQLVQAQNQATMMVFERMIKESDQRMTAVLASFGQMGAGKGGVEVGGAVDGRRKVILDNRDFEGMENFEGGEEHWNSWGHKVKVLTKPLCEELVEVMEIAEKKPGYKWSELVDELDVEGDATIRQKELVRKASAELYSLLMRRTKGDAALVVERVVSLDGVEAWGALHEKYNQKTMGRMFRQQRECMYPKVAKKLEDVESAVMEWEQKWRRMEKEMGKEMKIPDLMKMAALMEIVPRSIQDQLMMRMDEIGANYGAMREKLLRYTLNKVEQGKRGGPVDMEVDLVDKENEQYADVDAVYNGGGKRGIKGAGIKGGGKRGCYECGDPGHFARECPTKGAGKGGKDPDAAKGIKGLGKKGGGKGTGKGFQGYCNNCQGFGHPARECPSRRYINEAAEEEESVKDEDPIGGVWGIGAVEKVNDMEGPTVVDPPGLRLCLHGCRDPTSGECSVTCMDLNGWKVAARRGTKRSQALKKAAREENYQKFMNKNIFEEIGEVMEEGDVGNVSQELKEKSEMNEVVEVTIDSGASKSVWPRGHRGVERVRKDMGVKLAAANGTPIAVDGEATLKWSKGGRKRSMKFLDADVKRPLGAATAIVDAGNTIVMSRAGSYIQRDDTGERIQLERKRGVYVMRVNVDDMHADAKEKKHIKEYGMDVDRTGGEDDDEKDMVFLARASEEEMKVFRRHA